MSIKSLTSLSILFAGAAFHYFSQEQKADDITAQGSKKPKVKDENSSNEPTSSTHTELLDKFLFIIRGVKKSVSICIKTTKKVKIILDSGITSLNFRDLFHSPKSIESMIHIIGTLGIVYLNFKPFDNNIGKWSKVKTIFGSILTESNNIKTMHRLMMGISELAKNRKPPIKHLTIAGVMILGSHLANKYTK